MSAEPVYSPPAPIRDRLHHLAAAEQRVAAREAALAERVARLEEAEKRARWLEDANRKRARVAKRVGAELAEMNTRLVERKRKLARQLEEVDAAMRRPLLPSVHGGREGLYRAEREIQEHERKKKRLARQTGQ
jgi:predicted deacetylase